MSTSYNPKTNIIHLFNEQKIVNLVETAKFAGVGCTFCFSLGDDSCADIPLGSPVKFSAEISVEKCLDAPQTVNIFPIGKVLDFHKIFRWKKTTHKFVWLLSANHRCMLWTVDQWESLIFVALNLRAVLSACQWYQLWINE